MAVYNGIPSIIYKWANDRKASFVPIFFDHLTSFDGGVLAVENQHKTALKR